MSPRLPVQDPFESREAALYDNPIPSREFITLLLEKREEPMGFKHIAQELEIDDEERLEALRRRLRAMERDGQLHFNRRGGYGLLSRMNLVRGRVIGHPDGFGFLVPDEGDGDLFLSAREMRGCLHGDRVVAHITGVDQRGRQEGSITEVLEHAHTKLAGRYRVEESGCYVVADNRRISQEFSIPEGDSGAAEEGQLVVVEIIRYPTKRSRPTGRIVEVLGDHMAPGLEIDMSIRSFDIPTEWNKELLAESRRLPKQVVTEDYLGRIDLRDMPLVTIDGDDSMDFDDAVYAERSGKGWRLVVAIADVSHYVQPGSALDKEANLRGNSVYFPGRVVPMLPESLSNGLCSLNPKVERLCMACDMEISAKGKLKSFRFYPAVMFSHARLTYTKVARILVDRDAKLAHQYGSVISNLNELYALYKTLHKRRQERGAIDFDTTETKFIFGEGKKIEKIVAVERNDAHRLIEECMLLANVAAADLFEQHHIPILYRVHDVPKATKLKALREFLAELGLQLRGGDKPTSSDYAKLFETIRGRDDFHMIQTVMLRSFSQATYSPENRGHFGLSFGAYTHFTSPIRRYPDLLVHRAIRHIIGKEAPKSYRYEPTSFMPKAIRKMVYGGKGSSFRYGLDEMIQLGEHCSMTERRADEATRDAMDWLKCEHMLDRIGETFRGNITSVTSFGLFVELKEIFVEGLVHITALNNDYYKFEAAKHRLIGERTHKMYRLSDSIDVRLVRVDLDERKIDFELAESGKSQGDEHKGERRKRKPKKRSRGSKSS